MRERLAWWAIGGGPMGGLARESRGASMSHFLGLLLSAGTVPDGCRIPGQEGQKNKAFTKLLFKVGEMRGSW